MSNLPMHKENNMGKVKTNWINNPSLKQLVLLTIVWAVGSLLLILSMTDFFTERFFQKNYVLVYFLMIGATWTMSKLYRSYLEK